MPQMKDFRQAVLALFVNDNNEVLIGSSPRDGGYKFPQGGLDSGETPIEGLIREVREELGVILTDSDICPLKEERIHYYYPVTEPLRNNYIGQEFFIFKVLFHDRMRPAPQDDEFDRLLWIKPEDLLKYDTHHRKEAYRKALELYHLIE